VEKFHLSQSSLAEDNNFFAQEFIFWALTSSLVSEKFSSQPTDLAHKLKTGKPNSACMDHGKILTKKKLMGLPDILFEIISFFELKIRSQSDLHHLG
jgi:hypothetical protein